MKFYLQFLCVAGSLKHSNATPKVNIHKYTNCNMIKIYINRLSTTTQVFMAMDYSIMMSEKYFHFRKRQKNLAKTFFSHPVEVTGSMNFGNSWVNWDNHPIYGYSDLIPFQFWLREAMPKPEKVSLRFVQDRTFF